MISADYDIWAWAKEDTYGVDAVDAILAGDLPLRYEAVNNGSTITPLSTNFQPDRARPSQDGVYSTHIKQGSQVALTVPLKAGVGENNVPNFAPVLESAGLIQTSSAGGVTRFDLQSLWQPSMSVWRWTPVLKSNPQTYRLRRATGVVGNLAISATVGQEPLIAFAGPGRGYFDLSQPAAWFNMTTGHPILDLAGPSISTATRCNAERLVCRNVTITWNGVTIPLSSMTLDNAMAAAAVETMNSEPTTATVVRSRAGVGAGTVQLAFETTDAGVAFDALLAGGEANTVANLVVTFLGITRKVTLTARVQFLPVISERSNNGTRGGDAQGILVADYEANPLGDNSLSAVFANI